MGKSIILLDSHGQHMISMAKTIAVQHKGQGRRVEIWDVYKLGFPQWGLFAERDLRETFQASGIDYHCPDLGTKTRSGLADIESKDFERRTYVTDRMRGNSPLRLISKSLLNLYLKKTVFWSSRLLELLSQTTEDGDIVLIRGGRSPWQVNLAEKRELIGNVEIKFWEGARYLGTTFAFEGAVGVHNRIHYQRSAMDLELEKGDIEFAQNFIGQSEKSYSKKWNFTGEEKSTERSHVFFSSSTFEFISMPELYNTLPFSDQYQAFAHVISKLDRSDASMILRIHPNLSNGSWLVQLKEVLRVRKLVNLFPDLKVKFHFDQINSYDLIRDSDLVVTSISSIGLEAALLEKPVISVGGSFYDLLFESRLDFRKDLEDYSPKKHEAVKLITFMRRNSSPVLPFLDDRTFSRRLTQTIARSPLLSFFSLYLNFTNSLSAKLGVAISRGLSFGLRREQVK